MPTDGTGCCCCFILNPVRYSRQQTGRSEGTIRKGPNYKTFFFFLISQFIISLKLRGEIKSSFLRGHGGSWWWLSKEKKESPSTKQTQQTEFDQRGRDPVTLTIKTTAEDHGCSHTEKVGVCLRHSSGMPTTSATSLQADATFTFCC